MKFSDRKICSACFFTSLLILAALAVVFYPDHRPIKVEEYSKMPSNVRMLYLQGYFPAGSKVTSFMNVMKASKFSIVKDASNEVEYRSIVPSGWSLSEDTVYLYVEALYDADSKIIEVKEHMGVN